MKPIHTRFIYSSSIYQVLETITHSWKTSEKSIKQKTDRESEIRQSKEIRNHKTDAYAVYL